MKRILLWLLALAAAIYVGYRLLQPRPTPPPPARAFVPIPDGATIDFSSGQAIIKDSAAEKTLIDAAVREMNDAAKNIQFAPLVPPKIEIPPPPER